MRRWRDMKSVRARVSVLEKEDMRDAVMSLVEKGVCSVCVDDDLGTGSNYL